MTTRVQKGGPIFRPVAKPRPKAVNEARHGSVAPLQSTSSGSGPSSSQTSTVAMPPPSAIPPRPAVSVEIQEVQTSHSESSLDVPPSRSSRPPAISSISNRQMQPRPPSIVSTSRSSLHDSTSIDQPTRVATPTDSSSAEPPILHQALPDEHVPQAPATVETADSSLLHAVSNSGDLSIDSSQIDPALLEAVVTALQQAEQSSQANHSFDSPSDVLQEPLQPAFPEVAQETAQSQTGTTLTALEEDASSRPRSSRRSKRSAAGDGVADESEESRGRDWSSSTSPRKTRRPRKRTRTESGGTARTSQTEDGQDGMTDGGRRRKSTGGRKARTPSAPAYDAEADPGEEIDPTSVTMGALCDDTGRGRVSSKAAQIVSNHAAWRTANKEKRSRMKIVMEAKKYGRSVEDEESTVITKESSTANPEERQDTTTGRRIEPEVGLSSTRAGSEEPQQGDDFDYSQAMSTSKYNVQVRIGPNGETIIDEESLFVDQNLEEDTSAYTHVEESDTTKFVNSATYSKKARGSRWSAEETELFYDALQQFGENYELISFILPGRDRKACKNKFKAEDRRDSARITYCLKNRRPYDIATLSRMTGKDFSGPTPVIRTPTPAADQIAQSAADADDAASVKTNGSQVSSKQKKKKTKTSSSADVEVLGNLSDLEDDDTDHALLQGLSF